MHSCSLYNYFKVHIVNSKTYWTYSVFVQQIASVWFLAYFVFKYNSESSCTQCDFKIVNFIQKTNFKVTWLLDDIYCECHQKHIYTYVYMVVATLQYIIQRSVYLIYHKWISAQSSNYYETLYTSLMEMLKTSVIIYGTRSGIHIPLTFRFHILRWSMCRRDRSWSQHRSIRRTSSRCDHKVWSEHALRCPRN